MNTSPHSVYYFEAKEALPKFTILGVFLAIFIVLVVLLSILGQAVEFVLIFEDHLSGEAMLTIALLLTLIGAAWFGYIHWKEQKETKYRQYVYKLRVEEAQSRLHLTKAKQKGYINFDKTYALFTEEGLFVSIGFWSPATGKLHGTITNEDDRWDRGDILELVTCLEQAGMQIKRKIKKVGQVLENKVIFKSKALNENTIWAFIILVGLGVATIMYDKLLENALFIVILGLLIYGVFMYNQKYFVITPQYLMVRNRWIPFYKHQIMINDIDKIKFEELDNDRKRLVVETEGFDAYRERRFYSKLTTKNQQQVAFLVTKQAKPEV